MESTCATVLAAVHDVRARVVVLDMFCGCGGMSMGMRAAGFPFVLGIDESPACRASYKANSCGTRSIEQRLRISDVEHWHQAMQASRMIGDLASCELVFLGGPPCQPYSCAGNRAGSADDRDCLPIAVAMAVRLRPLIVVLENVTGLFDGEFSEEVRSVLKPLLIAGYALRVSMHKCKNHGVPQLRERLLLTFTRNDAFDGRAYVPLECKLQLAKTLGARSSSVFPEDAICEPGFWAGQCPKELELDMPVLKARERIPGLTNCVGIVSARTYAPTIMTSSIKVNSYHRLIAIPKDREPSDLLYSDARLLHSRHVLLLQTFPRNFKLYGNLSEHSRQIGNAVPPMFAYDVAFGIKSLLGQVGGHMRYDASGIVACLTVLKSTITQLVSP